MNAVHWTRAVKALQERYGLTWRRAGEVYRLFKSERGKAVSLYAVARAPLRLPQRWKTAPAIPKSALQTASALRANRAVTALQQRYGLTRPRALEVYRIFKSERGRPVSVYAVNRAPMRLPQRWKPAAAKPAPAKRAKREPLPEPFRQPPPLPPRPKFIPRPTRRGQRPRNIFERMLDEAGLPVEIARSGAGKFFVHQWRDREYLQQIVDILAAMAYLARKGKQPSRQLLTNLQNKLQEKMDSASANNYWYGIMRGMFGDIKISPPVSERK